MSAFQVQAAGRQVVSKTSFWRITRGGRVIGWACGYQNALAKAALLQAKADGGAHHVRAA